MNAATVKMVYDQTAAVISASVRSFSISIDANTTLTGSGLLTNSGTMRHLFQGGPGQRYTANLIARTDRFLDQDNKVQAEEGLADRMTGLICTIGATEYRVMQVNVAVCGGLIRIALDSVEQVGV